MERGWRVSPERGFALSVGGIPAQKSEEERKIKSFGNSMTVEKIIAVTDNYFVFLFCFSSLRFGWLD